MGERLILKSINEEILTNQLVDSWLETNEMFITKKSFSLDRYSVEITFIDDESKTKETRENDFRFHFRSGDDVGSVKYLLW